MDHSLLLKELLYCSSTGIFTRLLSKGNTKAGTQLGNLTKKGYLKAYVQGKYVTLHRLAWFYVYGTWPSQLDHINTIKTDNRITNLRETTTIVNCANQIGPRKNNQSGFRGVHLIPKTGRWRAKISINGKRIDLGVFSTAEEASQAYESAKAPYLP